MNKLPCFCIVCHLNDGGRRGVPRATSTYTLWGDEWKRSSMSAVYLDNLELHIMVTRWPIILFAFCSERESNSMRLPNAVWRTSLCGCSPEGAHRRRRCCCTSLMKVVRGRGGGGRGGGGDSGWVSGDGAICLIGVVRPIFLHQRPR